MIEIFVLAVGSAFWPLLIAVTIVALRSPDPPRLLSFFLAGALLTTISLGTVIVLFLADTPLVDRQRSTFDPLVYFTAGVLVFVVGIVLLRLPPQAKRRKSKKRHNGSWAERALARGAALAFAAGIVFNLIPGVLPLVALKDIAELGYGTTGVILTVTGFYLVMFTPAEIPLISYSFAPERTAVLTNRFNDWLTANGRRLLAWVTLAFGVGLVLRGIVELF